jgi:hypothetical protein
MRTSIGIFLVVGITLAGCATNQTPPAAYACPQAGQRAGSTDVTSGPGMGGRSGMMGGGGMMGGTAESGSMPGQMMARSSPSVAPAPMTDATKRAVDRALQNEYAAEQLYRQIGDQFKRPFRVISFAEQRHAWALENLYAARGIEAPKAEVAAKAAPYKDLKAACAAGVAAEKANIALYDDALKLDLPADVRRTFTHLRMMSERHHLPIFERCE